MPALTPCFLATTPCENEIFAADGQIAEREGSHNVKFFAKIFTILGGVTIQYMPPREKKGSKSQKESNKTGIGKLLLERRNTCMAWCQ